MTQQIKVPLLPLPPVEERGDTEYFLIDYNGYCDKCVYSNQYAGIGWYSAADMNYNGTDKDWLGYLPPFKVVDGQIVFEVQL